jgi:hypothetical protein
MVSACSPSRTSFNNHDLLVFFTPANQLSSSRTRCQQTQPTSQASCKARWTTPIRASFILPHSFSSVVVYTHSANPPASRMMASRPSPSQRPHAGAGPHLRRTRMNLPVAPRLPGEDGGCNCALWGRGRDDCGEGVQRADLESCLDMFHLDFESVTALQMLPRP